MSRQTTSRVALLMLALAIFPGCSPTQPFYFHNDGDLSHFLDKATEIEYPDVESEPLPETSQCQAPLTVSRPDFQEMWDLTLEECITIALQNSKTIRQLGAVSPFGQVSGYLSSGGSGVYNVLGSTTVYSPAMTQSQGNRQGTNPTLEGAGGVEDALADFDAQLQIRGNSPSGSLIQRLDRADNRATAISTFIPALNEYVRSGLRTDLSKRTASGARFTMSNFTDYNRWTGPWDTGTNVGPGQKVNSDWTTGFEVRWDQPLLRGRGTMINRIPVMLARINEDISLVGFEAVVRNFVFDVEKTYWELHKYYRNLETAKIGRDSAQGAWRIVYEKFNEGVAPAQEEAYAREQYFQFRAGVERSLQDLYDTESRLRWMMGLAATDGRLIRPIDEPTLARVEFDWPSVQTEALVRSPELRQAKWTLKAREFEVIAAKNRLLPQLDVGMLYRWIGRGDELIRRDDSGKNFGSTVTSEYTGSAAFNELASGNYQEADIFVSFGMPVGFRRELTAVRNTQLKVAQLKAQMEDAELSLVHNLSNALRAIDSYYVQAQTHFNRWSAAEKEVESATAKWKGGADTVDKVLEAQSRRAQAQVAFYEMLVEYNKAIAYVHFQKGSLLEYNNIELTEGNWPQKAYWDALALARQRDASYYLNYGWTRPGVISRGPVDQGIGRPVMGQPTPAEVILTPEPMPAGVGPEEGATVPESLPMPEPLTTQPSAPETGPITGGPATLMLNAPLVRSGDAGQAGGGLANPLRSQSFELGRLGLDQLRPGTASAAQAETNSLRPASPETNATVQPAGYSATISDTPNNRN